MEHYKNYGEVTCQGGGPRTIQFAFRKGDFLLNEVTLMKFRDGYEYNDARLNAFMLRESTESKRTTDAAESGVDDLLAQIELEVTKSTGGASPLSRPRNREVEFRIDVPAHFNLLPPNTFSCTATFDAVDRCSGGQSAGAVFITEMSKALPGDIYSYYAVTTRFGPPSSSLDAYQDQYKKELDEQFATPSGFLEFNGSSVVISNEHGSAQSNIEQVAAGPNVRKMPGYECFEASSIGPGCFMLVHSEQMQMRNQHSFLFLAKAIPTESFGEQSWMPAIVAIARPSSASDMAVAMQGMNATEQSIADANAAAEAAGQPKPFPSFAFVQDDWESMYSDVYNGQKYAGSFGARQTHQMLFSAYQSEYAENCRASIPAGSPVSEVISTRLADIEEETNFDGSTTKTFIHEEYVSRRIPVRAEYFDAFNRISTNFMKELRADWLDTYRGPDALAFVDTSSPENYFNYEAVISQRIEMFISDAASFLEQEGCDSPTTKKYEQELAQLEMWE